VGRIFKLNWRLTYSVDGGADRSKQPGALRDWLLQRAMKYD